MSLRGGGGGRGREIDKGGRAGKARSLGIWPWEGEITGGGAGGEIPETPGHLQRSRDLGLTVGWYVGIGRGGGQGIQLRYFFDLSERLDLTGGEGREGEGQGAQPLPTHLLCCALLQCRPQLLATRGQQQCPVSTTAMTKQSLGGWCLLVG